jgi:hypothetical protein
MVTLMPRDSRMAARRGGGDALAERGHHAAGDEDVFGHVLTSSEI